MMRRELDLVERERLQRTRRIVDESPLCLGTIRGGPFERGRRTVFLERHDRDHAAVVGFTPQQQVGVAATSSGEAMAEKLASPAPAPAVSEPKFLIEFKQRVGVGPR